MIGLEEGDGPGHVRARPVVLLVEDEIFIRIASADALREAGFDVIEAADGGEALDVVRSGRDFDILATDITMPGEPDGLELAGHVRSMRPHVPVVVVSARLPGDADPRADRMIAKPYGISELVTIIEEMVDPLWRRKNEQRNAC